MEPIVPIPLSGAGLYYKGKPGDNFFFKNLLIDLNNFPKYFQVMGVLLQLN